MNFVVSVAVKSTVILLSAGALFLILRRASAATRHALLAIAILSAAILPFAEMFLPKWDVPLLTEPQTVTPFQPVQSVVRAVAVTAVVDANPTVLQNVRPDSGFSAIQYAAFAWVLGSVVFLSRLLLGVRAAHRLMAGARTIVDERWLSLADQLRSKFQVTEAVRLAISGERFSPMTSGLRKPAILLPADAGEWSDERRRLVLAHELAHVKRRDRLMQIVVQTVCSIYWFHPLFWFAARFLRTERERACDDQVLLLGEDPYVYATQLLQVARTVSSNRILSFATITMANGTQLETRLRSIMDSGRKRRSLSAATLASACLMAGLLMFAMTCLHLTAVPFPILLVTPLPAPVPTVAEVPEFVAKQPSLPHETPAVTPVASQSPARPVYQKWLDEDVVYIISPLEKEAFSALTTDEEREHFIEQFWARRDKAEHYERIAYANGRYGWGSVPGWKTDRARIYIMFGKPDAIDSHPAGGTGATYPYEIWTYRYLPNNGSNIEFEFVDSAQNGQYSLSLNVRAQNPDWMGAWSLNLAKSKLAVDSNGSAIPNPFDPMKVSFYPGLQGVRIFNEFHSTPDRGPAQVLFFVEFGATFSVGKLRGPWQGGFRSISFARIDDNTFQTNVRVYLNGLDQTGTGLAKVSSDGNTLTITNSIWPETFSVYDRQK